MDWVEIEHRTATIEHFVDLDGELIAQGLQFDSERETIPEDLTEQVEDGQCDEQEFEGYMGNVRLLRFGRLRRF